MKTKTYLHEAYCVFHYCPDRGPAWHDENNMPVTYLTKQEAINEICDMMEEHFDQARRGERDLDEIGFDDWIEVVRLYDDGSIEDKCGQVFGKRED